MTKSTTEGSIRMMELMTCNEYATSRGLPVVTVRGYCRNGIVPHLRLGKVYKLDPQLADEALAEVMQKNMDFKPNGVRRSRKKKSFDFNSALAAL